MDAFVRTVSDSKGSGEVIEDTEFGTTQQRSTIESDDGVLIGTAEDISPASNVIADEIPGDEDSEYEYEDEEEAAFSGFLVDNPAFAADATVQEEPAKIEEEQVEPPKPKWRQPSEQAVNMSLRAEKETTGGKRRLAQDLYRIMNQDTEEAGFSIKPSSEDCMDKWTIQLFQFDKDSNLAKDMRVLGLSNIELEMSFPDQYPFEPPFVRVTRPRFKRQTGFVMNGALCMELLTKDGWNPINDIESVIVSIRSLLVVGDGRLEIAANLPEAKYKALLEAADKKKKPAIDDESPLKRQKTEEDKKKEQLLLSDAGGEYSASEAETAYTHLSDYHKKKGWDTSGWWARKG